MADESVTSDTPGMVFSGWNHDELIIDTRHGPVTFLHQSAKVDATSRFDLPDGKDVTIAIGNRVVVKRDADAQRLYIAQVLPL
jgi:hypothetical protein